ncbi:MAG: NAD(P)-dependent glycerol-3-phosphate dehydrogenase [Proteobacteria bacterium]|nr:NAD(P)-dependent glycerol-3-phosphate dehydrogenase [Pseudomonadota bacterium]MDA1332032.1 NAD(P)-dependent glycerol-3-phosphate dehydrogenase [Pseudomonadota bacterium]
MKIAVIGAGAWGTALAVSIGRSSLVSLYSANADLVDSMNQYRENQRYLPRVSLSQRVQVTNALEAALDGASGIVMAVPTVGLRQSVIECHSIVGDGIPYLITCKGFEVDTGLLPFQVIEDVAPKARYAVLSGPSFARDVGEQKSTVVSLASADSSTSDVFSKVLLQGGIRTYFNQDVIGVSVGGAVKNVIAIAAGMGDALGIGASALAGLVTRGLSEVCRLGIALGAKPETFMGLSGMGDLALTCFSDLSRNRRLGYALGLGKSLREAEKALGQVAEGVHAANEVMLLARRLKVEMPITVSVTRVLSGAISPRDAAKELFARSPKSEL